MTCTSFRTVASGMIAVLGLTLGPAKTPFAQTVEQTAEMCLNELEITQCIQPVRPDRSFKTLVLEYIDTQATSIGHTLSRFTYREIREFTTDVADSVVIIVHNQTNNAVKSSKNPILTEPYQDLFAEALTSAMLRLQGHGAANAIGHAATAEVVSWGTAIDLADSVLVQPSLSIVDTTSPWKRVDFSGEYAKFSYTMPSWRINFGATSIPKSALFARQFIVRCNLRSQCPDGIPLRSQPSNDIAPIWHVNRGEMVTSTGAINQFLEVASDEGRRFMNIYHAELTPSVVHIEEDAFAIRGRPSSGASIVFRGPVDGLFDVLALEKDASDPSDEHIRNNWYKISVEGTEGWFQNKREFYGATQPKNLVNAGLYRLFAKQPEIAANLFKKYLALTQDTSPPETHSIVYQLLAFAVLSEAFLSRKNFAEAGAQANSYLEEAQEKLPFSAKPLFLRSLILLCLGKTEEGVDSIRQALKLNALDTTFSDNASSELCFSNPTTIDGHTVTGCVSMKYLIELISNTSSK